MPASIFGNPAAVVQLNQALFGIAPGNGKYTNQLDQANAVGAIPFARQLGQTVAATNEALAATVLANVGIVNATLQTALVQAFAAFPNDRGVVVLNLTNILTTLEGNAVYGAAAAQFNAQVATDFQYSTNSVNTTDSPITAGTVTLTANTDTVTGNLFNAGLVFTPGGDDRINSLQDEDVLTGTGTNATLNATLGNANDNGGVVITPTISGVSTINVAFSGSAGGAGAVNELDLQDTTGTITNLNINRINDGIVTARIDNIGNAVANLSVSRSGQVAQNVDFAFTAGALAGAADSTTLTLNQVNVNNLFVEERLTNFDEGFETINLVSGGTTPNSVVLFQAEDLQTLNISGGARLTIGGTASTVGAQGIEATRYTGGLGQVAGSLTAINASALTANLDIVLGAELTAGLDGTSGLPANVTVTGGAGNDTFRLASGAQVQVGDRIVGGAGTNTLQLLGNNVVNATATNTATVTAVQNLDIRTGQDLETSAANALAAPDTVTVDARAIADLATVTIRNEGQFQVPAAGIVPAGPFTSTREASTVNLSNVNAATANGITVLHGTSGNSNIVGNNINVTSAVAGVTTGGLTIQDGINSNPQFNVNLSFDSDGTALNATNTIVNVNLRDQDTESNTVRLLEVARHTGTLTLTGGATVNATQFFNLDAQANTYRYAQDGSASNGTGVATGVRAANNGVDAADRLQFSVIDFSTYTGNTVSRLGLANTGATFGAQSVTGGTGSDTYIFDVLNDQNAGFSISDNVRGGDGNDILAFDGHGTRITIQASEFQNTTGIETLRFLNNGAAAIVNPGNTNGNGVALFGNNSYNLSLNERVIDANGTANGAARTINVVNDSDNRGDDGVATADEIIAELRYQIAVATVGNGAVPNAAALTATLGAGAAGSVLANQGLTIDLRQIDSDQGIVFNGDETQANLTIKSDAVAAAVNAALNAANPALNLALVAGDSLNAFARVGVQERFIFDDRNINAFSTIDGGAVWDDNLVAFGISALAAPTAAQVLAAQKAAGADFGVVNAAAGVTGDIIEVRNAASVTADDLRGISNVNNLFFTNDTTSVQTSNVTLNDAVIDAMVNNTRVATGNNTETLNIDAQDSLTVPAAFTQINLNAANVTNTALRINFDGGGASDSVTGGAGADTINGQGGDDIINGGGGNDVIRGALGADRIDVGVGTDTIQFDVGTDLQPLGGVAITAADTIVGFVSGAAGDVIDLGGALRSAGAAPVNVATVLGGADNINAGAVLTENLGTTALNAAGQNGRVVYVAANAINANFTTQAGIDAGVTALTAAFAANGVANTVIVFALTDNQAVANTALFLYSEGAADAGVDAAELQLIGVGAFGAVGTLTDANFA